jgi:hypothetical protein
MITNRKRNVRANPILTLHLTFLLLLIGGCDPSTQESPSADVREAVPLPPSTDATNEPRTESANVEYVDEEDHLVVQNGRTPIDLSPQRTRSPESVPRAKSLVKSGSMTFREIPMQVPTGKFAAVAMGDIDKDGYAEVVSGHIDGEEGLFLFVYTGSHWTKRQLTTQGEYGGVALADITGDSVLDIVAVKTNAKGSTDGVELLESALKQGEITMTARPSPFSGKACGDVAVGDIEGDGDMDLAVSTRGDGVKVLVNEGQARSFRVLSLATDNYEDTGIGLGDLNGDRRLDVIATNHPGNNPRLFLCASSGEVDYDDGHTEGISAGECVGFDICIAALDGDDFGDMAIGTGRGIKLFLGSGCQGAESTWWREAPMANRGSQTMQGAVGDVDLDGEPDIVFASASGMIVYLNGGAGRFSKWQGDGLPEKGGYSGCCLHDWDTDGDLDLVCSSLQGLGVRFFENRLVRPSN